VSACDELRATAAGIAALPAGDPEREAFLAHARGCAGCMEALREGEKVVAALGSAGLPPPSSHALQRASAPILAELSPSHWRLRAAAVLAGFAVPMLFSRNRDWEGWGAALVALVLATVLSATAGVVRAGAWVALAASAGFAIAAGGIPGFAGTGEELAAHLGCDQQIQFALLLFVNMTFARTGLIIRRCFAPMSKSTRRKQVKSLKQALLLN